MNTSMYKTEHNGVCATKVLVITIPTGNLIETRKQIAADLRDLADRLEEFGSKVCDLPVLSTGEGTAVIKSVWTPGAIAELEADGFSIDNHCNPPVAYKGPRFNPETIIRLGEHIHE